MKKELFFGILVISILHVSPSMAKEKEVRFGDARHGQKLFNELIEKCSGTCGDIIQADSLANGNRISVQSKKDLIRKIQGDLSGSDKIDKAPGLLGNLKDRRCQTFKPGHNRVSIRLFHN